MRTSKTQSNNFSLFVQTFKEHKIFEGTVCDCTLLVCIDIVKNIIREITMGRNNTITMQYIHSVCGFHNLNEKELYKNTKSVLSSYREISWTFNNILSEKNTIIEYLSNDKTRFSLLYWLKFVPEASRIILTKKATISCYNNFFSKIMEASLSSLNEYPVNGNLYKNIIIECYLGKHKLTENEILQKLPAMDRSTYYDRKKEAILLFGIILCDTLTRSSLLTD